MVKKILLALLPLLFCSCIIMNIGCGKGTKGEDVFIKPGTIDNSDLDIATPDTWAAIDELGRDVMDGAIAKHGNRSVIMFYFIGKDPMITAYTASETSIAPHKYPVNVTEVLEQYPDAINNYNHPAWGGPWSCWWNRPIFGYYRTTDPWVLRKHAELLADAGVDAVVFDCSNDSWLYEDSADALAETWSKAKEDGVNVPKFAYLLPFSASEASRTSLRRLYQRIYKSHKYEDLWFKLNGKPFIMAYPDNLTDSSEDIAIKNFFEFRPGQPNYYKGPSRNDQWGWLEDYPQHVYANGEEMTVGVAQNASDYTNGGVDAFNAPLTYGRSYTKANGHDDSDKAYLKGANFQEQWDRALSYKPKHVFITGWNEWTAGRRQGWGVRKNLAFSMLDQFDNEHSRDIEPTSGWGDYGDVYYYQLVQNVRRYKGVKTALTVSDEKTIKIGSFKGWKGVSPDYKHYKGNTLHRNHNEYSQNGTVYVNNTGRNDLVDARVARDKEFVYFYIETADAITPRTDPKWMRLFINVDRNIKTGWKGYDFALNYKNPKSDSEGYISKCTGQEWKWVDAGSFEYAVKGNILELKVAKSALGVSGKLNFEFKWSDNMQDEGNILDFYVNGDAAPGGRFNFVYTEP